MAAAGLDPNKHMVAVTSETSPLAKSSQYLASFFIDDFIGGRYSSTSAVGGAILSLAFGPKVFEEILAGAHEADALARNPNIRAERRPDGRPDRRLGAELPPVSRTPPSCRTARRCCASPPTCSSWTWRATANP